MVGSEQDEKNPENFDKFSFDKNQEFTHLAYSTGAFLLSHISHRSNFIENRHIFIASGKVKYFIKKHPYFMI